MALRALSLCFLVLAVSLCLADPPKPSPAPDLGPEKYTIHFAGTLRDTLQSLCAITGRYIAIDVATVNAQPPGHRSAYDTPVSLNFDNAPLSDILLSLCKQAGLTYEVYPWNSSNLGAVDLFPGDPALDCRPVCVLKDYTLHITSIAYVRSSPTDFRWGAATPQRRDPTNSIEITIEVTPTSPHAAALFAGLYPHADGVANAGGLIHGRGFGRASTLPRDERHEEPRVGAMAISPMNLELSAPDPAATMLTRLDGLLLVNSQVKDTELRIPQPAVGKIASVDDLRATITAWKVEASQVQVEVEGVAPLLPGARSTSHGLRDWQAMDLLGADGRRARYSSSSLSFPGPGDMNFKWSFVYATPTGFVPDTLVLTFHRCGPVDKEIRFTFTNIPLP